MSSLGPGRLGDLAMLSELLMDRAACVSDGTQDVSGAHAGPGSDLGTGLHDPLGAGREMPPGKACRPGADEVTAAGTWAYAAVTGSRVSLSL